MQLEATLLGDACIIHLTRIDTINEEARSLLALTLCHHHEALMQQELLLEDINRWSKSALAHIITRMPLEARIDDLQGLHSPTASSASKLTLRAILMDAKVKFESLEAR